MQHSPPWRAALGGIVVFVLSFFALIGIATVAVAANSLRPLLLFLIMGVFLGAITALVIRLFRRLFHRQAPRSASLRTWLKASAIWTALLLALASVPLLVATNINSSRPLAMPRITLTDGKKQVVFQGMVHVGSEPFYQGVIFDLLQAADEGYVLFFEGVRPGAPENQERLNELLGTRGVDLSQVYDSMAQGCNLEFQNNYFSVFRDDMQNDPARFVVADITVDEMMAEWDRLLAEQPELAAAQAPIRSAEDVDRTDEQGATVLDGLSELTPGQRRLAALACQAFFNVSLGSEGRSQKPFQERVVLDFRNRHLADQILSHPGDRIYITYGNAHFPGVYALLRQADPNWRITDVQWRQAIEDRAELERRLNLEP